MINIPTLTHAELLELHDEIEARLCHFDRLKKDEKARIREEALQNTKLLIKLREENDELNDLVKDILSKHTSQIDFSITFTSEGKLLYSPISCNQLETALYMTFKGVVSHSNGAIRKLLQEYATAFLEDACIEAAILLPKLRQKCKEAQQKFKALKSKMGQYGLTSNDLTGEHPNAW